MRRFQVLPMATLIVVAALSEPGHLLAQEASRPLPVPTAVTLGFEGEGLPYGDKGLTPEEIRDTFGPATQILCVAYSADGKTLAVGDGPTREICAFPGPPLMNENGGLIRLVDTATHRVRVVLGPTKVRQHEYEVQRLTFSAEGKVLVAAGLEDYVVDARLVYVSSFTAWDASTGRQLYRIAGATNDRWIRSAIAANAGILAAATERVVVIWDGSTGRQRHALGDLPSRPTMLAFSPDGHALACGFEDGSATVWDASTAQRAAQFPGHERHGQRYAIDVLAFSPDGRDLASAGTFRRDEGELYKDYSEMRIFSLAGRLERATMPGCDGEIFKCLAFSPDGKTVVSGGAGLERGDARSRGDAALGRGLGCGTGLLHDSEAMAARSQLLTGRENCRGGGPGVDRPTGCGGRGAADCLTVRDGIPSVS